MHIKTNMTDVETLRKQARQNIDNGAVTAGYADLMLNLPMGEQH